MVIVWSQPMLSLYETRAVARLSGRKDRKCFVKPGDVYPRQKANHCGDRKIATQRNEPGIHTVVGIAAG